MVLVDSSAWIEAARRNGDLACKVAIEALLDEDEAALTGPVRLEVLGGARPDDRKRLQGYLSLLPFFPVEEIDWQAAIGNGWTLRDRGLAIPWNDLLVATLALRLRFRVYARDRHFDDIGPVLGLDLYAPGPGGSFAPP
jgi:predicted nucleic acid-binding protein